MKCIVSTWNKFPAFSHVNSFITQGALLSNMHPNRKQRPFFIFLVMKMAKYRKIRYRSRFRPSCHFRDGQYRLQNNTNLLAGQGDRPSKCRFSRPMAIIFLKPPHFHQYPHYINVIEVAMMVPQLLNIVTCGRCNWGEDGTGYKDGNFEAYAQAMRKVCRRKKVHFS